MFQFPCGPPLRVTKRWGFPIRIPADQRGQGPSPPLAVPGTVLHRLRGARAFPVRGKLLARPRSREVAILCVSMYLVTCGDHQVDERLGFPSSR